MLLIIHQSFPPKIPERDAGGKYAVVCMEPIFYDRAVFRVFVGWSPFGIVPGLVVRDRTAAQAPG